MHLQIRRPLKLLTEEGIRGTLNYNKENRSKNQVKGFGLVNIRTRHLPAGAHFKLFALFFAIEFIAMLVLFGHHPKFYICFPLFVDHLST